MGNMADYDMYENINNVGKLEFLTYKCGYCNKKFGNDAKKCQEHANKCDSNKVEEPKLGGVE